MVRVLGSHGGGVGVLPGDAHQELSIKQLRETDLGMTWAFLAPQKRPFFIPQGFQYNLKEAAG